MAWSQRFATSGAGPLLLQSRPAQRLLVQGVMALTGQLVRGIGEQRDPLALRGLMGERHRMVRELGNSVGDGAALTCLAAMTAAVLESDRALEVILGA
jgi:hypothetical protein